MLKSSKKIWTSLVAAACLSLSLIVSPATGVQAAENKGSLKLNLNYQNTDWDESSIMVNFTEGKDLTAYDKLEYDVYLPKEFNGKLNMSIVTQTTDAWTWSQGVFTEDYTVFESAKATDVVTINGKEYFKIHRNLTATGTMQKPSYNFILIFAGQQTTYAGPMYLDNIKLTSSSGAEAMVYDFEDGTDQGWNKLNGTAFRVGQNKFEYSEDLKGGEAVAAAPAATETAPAAETAAPAAEAAPAATANPTTGDAGTSLIVVALLASACGIYAFSRKRVRA